MPKVTAIPRGQSNGDIITEFVDTANISATTFVYPNEQESLTIRNDGVADVTLTLNGTSYTVQPSKSKSVEVVFISFSISSVSGTQQFTARANSYQEDVVTATGRKVEILSSDALEDVQTMRESMKFPDTKGLVSIRFDDNDYTVYQTAYPLLKARAMPFTLAAVANRVGNYPLRTKVTDAQMIEMGNYGMEIASHSFIHTELPVTQSEVYNEVVSSKRELERALGFHVRNLIEPGTWNNGATKKSLLGETIMNHYSFYESYANTPIPNRPLYERFGINHQTGDGQTATAIKGWIDQVAGIAKSVIIMFHSIGDVIGGTAGVSSAIFTDVLDYLKTLRDQGKIEVVTDSGIMGAGIGTAQNYLINGGFENLNASNLPVNFNIVGAPSIVTVNPKSGLNALSTTSANYVTAFVSCYGMCSPVLKVSAWHRTDTTGTARIMTNMPTGVCSATMTSTTTWQKIELTVGVPLGSERFTVYAQPSGAGTVIYDDLEMIRVG